MVSDTKMIRFDISLYTSCVLVVQAIEEAFVPVIKLKFDGVEVGTSLLFDLSAGYFCRNFVKATAFFSDVGSNFANAILQLIDTKQCFQTFFEPHPT